MPPRPSHSLLAASVALTVGTLASLGRAQGAANTATSAIRVIAPDARVTARRVLVELSPTLGMTDPLQDLREVSAQADRHGRAHIAYERIVGGLPVRDTELIVHVGASGAVEATTGALSPLVSGAQEAIKEALTRATMTETDIRDAILRDLAVAGHDPVRLRRFVARKEALMSAPWVAWHADVTLDGAAGRWVYDMDATNGAILSRRSNLQDGEAAAARGPLSARSVNGCSPLVGPSSPTPLSHTTPFIYVARALNVTSGRDGDGDGFPETFSFDLSVDADWADASDSGYVALVIRCPTTGQFWTTASWWTSGIADDPVAFAFTQANFGLAVPANASLDLTVELWDPALVNRFDIEPTVVGEPVRADHITPGLKVGTGVGVHGNALTHVDAYYDDEDYAFFLFDISRRSGSNPHGHAGGMPSSEAIETDVFDLPAPFIAYDFDDTWNGSYQASAVDAHVGAGLVYDYLRGSLGLNGIDGDGAGMLSLVDVPHTPDNASWDGLAVSYGEPARLSLSLAGALDVVAHEWGHAVTELAAQPRRWDLVYVGESGALNESFSDWLGAAVEHSRGETNWTLGEGIEIVRDIANPPAYGQPDDYLADPLWFPVLGCIPDETNDDCGVHTNSGVPNKMFYLLSAGGTHRGIVVSGLGIATAMEIALDANIFYWPSNATFAQARVGMLDAAAPLGTNAVSQVANAWAAVGVGLPSAPVGLGDVAPRAAPNGVVDVGDVVTVLRFSVGLDGPTAAERQRADVAPYAILDATRTPRTIRVAPDGRLDVADVVILMRVSVGIDAFGT